MKFFGRKTKASYLVTVTILVQKVAYIYAVLLERERFVYLLLLSVLRNMSYEWEKNFRKNFCPFFAQKHYVWKNISTSFLSQIVGFKTLVQFTKPWTLYSVSVLRYRGSKWKIVKKAFFQKFFGKKLMKPIFFETFFRRKCSLGSCATLSENMVSVSLLGFGKIVSEVWKISTCHEICEKKHRRDGMSRLGTSRNVQWPAEGAANFLCSRAHNRVNLSRLR